MYDYEMSFSEDYQTEITIEKYMQSQMLYAIKNMIGDDVIVDKFDREEELTSKEIKLLIERCMICFPEGFNKYCIPEIVRELYFIIASDDRYVPDIMEEYVLAMAIEDMAGMISQGDLFKSDVKINPLPDRAAILQVLIAEDMENCGADYEESKEIIEGQIRGWEDFSGIIESCFYDTDFAFLDAYAVDELVESGMDKTFGMGVTEPARKRLPDGSFEYINRVPQYSQETIVVKISKKS